MTDEVLERWRRLPVGADAMDVMEVVPSDPRGAVVVLHEAWGVTGYTQDVARRLAAGGLHVVAPDLLHRDPEPHPITYGELDRLLPAVERMRDEHVLADLAAVRDILGDDGWEPHDMAVLGFCLGGRFAFLGAVTWAWAAAVSFYPGGIVTPAFETLPPLVGRAEGLRAPWLGLFGDRDDTIAVADVERLRAELEEAVVDADVVRYAEVGHAFHNDRRPSYVADAAEDAWERATAWIGQRLP